MTNRDFSVALLITTYNRPDALALVLKAVAGQSVLPDEVLIADDGSRDDTRQMLAEFARKAPFRLRHIWHEDDGFRVGVIRNKAIAAAKSDYIIQIDGDMLPHRRFIEDHLRLARRGYMISGGRILTDQRLTAELIARGDVRVTMWRRGLKNRLNALRLPLLSPLLYKVHSDSFSVRSCNLAVWRDDMIRVNGYNEDIVGWGREDSELALRLMNAGVRKRTAKLAALAYHLYHCEASRDSLSRNDTILDTVTRARADRCENGISKHLQ